MQKTAAMPPLGAIGKGLMNAASRPGVMKRVGIGAGIGAAGGFATKGEGESGLGATVGGAALGAVGGAMSHKQFRAGAGRAVKGMSVKPVAVKLSSEKTARPLGELGKGLWGAVKGTPGLAGRTAVGAAVGAGGGYATKQEGDRGVGRAIGGGLLGAAAGAASHGAFRENVGKVIKPGPVAAAAPAVAAAAGPGGAKAPLALRAGVAANKAMRAPTDVARVVRANRREFSRGLNAGKRDVPMTTTPTMSGSTMAPKPGGSPAGSMLPGASLTYSGGGSTVAKAGPPAHAGYQMPTYGKGKTGRGTKWGPPSQGPAQPSAKLRVS